MLPLVLLAFQKKYLLEEFLFAVLPYTVLICVCCETRDPFQSLETEIPMEDQVVSQLVGVD